MTTLYKLTDEHWWTGRGHGRALRWGHGVTHHVRRRGTPTLCTSAVIHAYRTPEEAAFMAPQYGYKHGTLWEAEGKVVVEDPTKVGCRSLTTWHTADLPVLATEVWVRAAIAVARLTNPPAAWCAWADRWDSGEDRTANAANAAHARANAAASATRAAAAYAAIAADSRYANAAYAAAAYAAYAAMIVADDATFDLTHLIHEASDAEAALAGGQS